MKKYLVKFTEHIQVERQAVIDIKNDDNIDDEFIAWWDAHPGQGIAGDELVVGCEIESYEEMSA